MKKSLKALAILTFVFVLAGTAQVFAWKGPKMAGEDRGCIKVAKVEGKFDGETISSSKSGEIILFGGTGKTGSARGISYKKSTNTLTLKNVKNRKLALTVINMGDDFKIKLVGSNELLFICYNATGYNTNLTLTGNGSLILNRRKYMYGIGGIGMNPSAYGKFPLRLTVSKSVKLTIHPKKVSGNLEVYGSPILVMNSSLSKSKAIVLKSKAGAKVKIYTTEKDFGSYYHTGKTVLKI